MGKVSPRKIKKIWKLLDEVENDLLEMEALDAFAFLTAIQIHFSDFPALYRDLHPQGGDESVGLSTTALLDSLGREREDLNLN